MAMAEPEADPQLLYTAGVHTPVTSINNVPVVNAVPHVYTTGVHAPTVGVVGSTVYSHPTVYYGKRDAEAFYGVYGYSAYRPYAYSAYRPYAYTTRWGYGKRSADAEAEADPALVYTSAVPAVHSVVSSPLVSALTPAATLKTVHTPVTYTHAVHTPVVNTVGSTVYYGKREAEADPALLYTNAVPAVHSVVGTHAVLVHSSHAGICLNNVGVQVPC